MEVERSGESGLIGNILRLFHRIYIFFFFIPPPLYRKVLNPIHFNYLIKNK